MNDQIPAVGAHSGLDAAQNTDHSQFRRPLTGEHASEPAKNGAKAASARTSVPGGKAPLLSVLPEAFSVPEPERPNTPAPVQEPTDATEEQAAEPEQPPRFRWTRSQLLYASLALILVVLLLDQLVMPLLRYRKALKLEAAGDYEQAIASFAALDDYRDSSKHIDQIREEQARLLINEGQYREAMALLEARGKTTMLIADCLYALGVTAYNEGDLATALDYVMQLRERFPKYDKLKELEQRCYYDLGTQAVDAAVETTDSLQAIAYYENAIDHYAKVRAYSDAAERILECQYRIAGLYAAEWRLPDAIALYQKLGNYQDSDRHRLQLMYIFVLNHFQESSELVDTYLNALIAADYSGTQALLDRRNGTGFHFELVYGPEGAPLPDPVTELSNLYIRYAITAQDGAEPVTVKLSYLLPGGGESTSWLNRDGSASGLVNFVELFSNAVYCNKSGPVVLRFSDDSLGAEIILQTLSFSFVPPEAEGGSAP